MPTPPPELTWIGIFASMFALLFHGVNLILIYRNRGRIEYRLISAKIYYRPWDKYEVESAHPWPAYHDLKPKPGDCKEAFTVIEFALRSLFPTEVTLGPFLIGEWIFADHYPGGLHHPLSDYRVFDLFTRARTTLDAHTKLAPKASLGFRVEISEKTEGPEYHSQRSRYTIKLPKNYKLQFYLDGKKHRNAIRFDPPQITAYQFKEVYRWSDLLGTEYFSGAPVPQPIPMSDIWPRSWRMRLIDCSLKHTDDSSPPLMRLLGRIMHRLLIQRPRHSP